MNVIVGNDSGVDLYISFGYCVVNNGFGSPVQQLMLMLTSKPANQDSFGNGATLISTNKLANHKLVRANNLPDCFGPPLLRMEIRYKELAVAIVIRAGEDDGQDTLQVRIGEPGPSRFVDGRTFRTKDSDETHVDGSSIGFALRNRTDEPLHALAIAGWFDEEKSELHAMDASRGKRSLVVIGSNHRLPDDTAGNIEIVARLEIPPRKTAKHVGDELFSQIIWADPEHRFEERMHPVKLKKGYMAFISVGPLKNPLRKS